MTDPLDLRLLAACAIVREAGQLAHDYFLRRESLEIEFKGKQDLVSVADRAVEDVIRAHLARAFPEDDVIGEEGGFANDRGGDRVWVIDPIDGTSNFLRGVPYWTVALAYVVDGRTEIAVTFDPVHDELYAARRGHGATRNGRRIQVSGRTDPGRCAIGTAFSFKASTEGYLGLIDEVLRSGLDHRRLGSSALMLCHVADGRLDGVAMIYCHAWDVVGGLLLVEEAGGVANDFLADAGLTVPGPAFAGTPALRPTLESLSGVQAAAAASSVGHDADGAARRARRQRGVGLERGRDAPLAALRRLPAGGILRGAAAGQLVVGDREANAAVRDVDLDRSPSSHQPDRAALGRLGRDVADRQARGAAREAPVGDQRAGLAEALRFQVAGRVEHLLHARARRAGLRSGSPPRRRPATLPPRMPSHRRVLALEHARRAGELQDALVDARPSSRCSRPRARLPYSTARPPSLREGVLARRGCTPVSRSRSSSSQRAVLAEGGLRRHAARRGAEEVAHRLARRCASTSQRVERRRRASALCTVRQSRCRAGRRGRARPGSP